jgi:hypothetical protein
MYIDIRDAVTADDEAEIASTNRAPELMQLLADLPASCPVRACTQVHSCTLQLDLTEMIKPNVRCIAFLLYNIVVSNSKALCTQ